MTEEVQTGRNPIANIADIVDIENPIADIVHTGIANITDIENPIANIADTANIAEFLSPSQIDTQIIDSDLCL